MRYRKQKKKVKPIDDKGIAHTDLRSRERMSRALDHSDILSMRKQISSRYNAWFVKKGTPCRGYPTEKWVILYDNRYWTVVYMPYSGYIITVLGPPSDWQMIIALRQEEIDRANNVQRLAPKQSQELEERIIIRPVNWSERLSS